MERGIKDHWCVEVALPDGLTVETPGHRTVRNAQDSGSIDSLMYAALSLVGAVSRLQPKESTLTVGNLPVVSGVAKLQPCSFEQALDALRSKHDASSYDNHIPWFLYHFCLWQWPRLICPTAGRWLDSYKLLLTRGREENRNLNPRGSS